MFLRISASLQAPELTFSTFLIATISPFAFTSARWTTPNAPRPNSSKTVNDSRDWLALQLNTCEKELPYFFQY